MQKENFKKKKDIWEKLKQFLSVCQQFTERPHPSEILWLSAWKEHVNLFFCLRQGDFKQSSYHFIFLLFVEKVTKKQPTNIFFFGGEIIISLLENMILLKTPSLAVWLMRTGISRQRTLAQQEYNCIKVVFFKARNKMSALKEALLLCFKHDDFWSNYVLH